MIVGVAIKIGDHIEIRLPKPNRHCDCFWYFKEKTGVTAPSLGMRTGGENQGFYTHTGRYLNREQAYKYVKRIKQKTTEHIGKKYLFSEDLW